MTNQNASASINTVGYHATAAENVSAIFRDGFITKGEGNWLGPGAYFFEAYWTEYTRQANRGRESALRWARANKKYSRSAVLSVDLHLNRCLDLVDDQDSKEAYLMIRDQIVNDERAKGRQLAKIDAATLRTMQRRLGHTSIRAFVNRNPRGYEFFVICDCEIQICVTDPSEITNCRVIYQEPPKECAT